MKYGERRFREDVVGMNEGFREVGDDREEREWGEFEEVKEVGKWREKFGDRLWEVGEDGEESGEKRRDDVEGVEEEGVEWIEGKDGGERRGDRGGMVFVVMVFGYKRRGVRMRRGLFVGLGRGDVVVVRGVVVLMKDGCEEWKDMRGCGGNVVLNGREGSKGVIGVVFELRKMVRKVDDEWVDDVEE